MSTLLTERLALLPPAAVQPAAVADFLARNTAHFARWDPPRPAGLATEAFQRESLPKQEREFAEGSCYRWYLVSHAEPTRVIGKLELSGVARGPFQNAYLGYALDQHCQGQGYMIEAARAVVAAAFGPDLQLHRLQASHRPENQRSARVLERLGFRELGLAVDYLFIDGAWRDHRVMELVNPGFVLAAEPG